MKNSEIKELTIQELNENIEDEKVRLTNLRMNHSVSPLENPLQLKNSKKLIARLKTELRKRQIEENKQK